MIIQIETQILWKYDQDKETGQFVGASDVLKITAVGDTYPLLLEAIGTAIDDVFNSRLEDGDLKEFMNDHGIKLVGSIPSYNSETDYSFEAPITTQRGLDYGGV